MKRKMAKIVEKGKNKENGPKMKTELYKKIKKSWKMENRNEEKNGNYLRKKGK